LGSIVLFGNHQLGFQLGPLVVEQPDAEIDPIALAGERPAGAELAVQQGFQLATGGGDDGVGNVSGTTGDDILTVGVGDYAFDGGAGTDTVVFPGDVASYSVEQTSTGYTITAIGGNDDTASLTSIERVQFTDEKIAFDMGGSAGKAVKFIGAALGTEFLKPAYDSIKGQAIAIFDSGTTMKQLSDIVVGHPDFIKLEGTNSNTDFVKYIYRTITGQVASESDVTILVKYLNDGMTQGDFLAAAADLGLNVDLVGLAKTGIDYT